MTARTLKLDDALYGYLLDVSLRETPLLKRLREETQALPMARWQVAPEQGQFLALLVKLTGARRLLEVGTFTGYSALCMASALPEGGSLLCCDIPGDYNATALRYWREAGLAERIELRLAPALETLALLEQQGQGGQFDLIFIDADKANYPAYLESALRLLRAGGLAIFDNTLWSGRVLEVNGQSADTRAIQVLNRALKDDAVPQGLGVRSGLLEQQGDARMVLAGFVVQFAISVGKVPGNGAAVGFLQVIDHVLQVFRAGALLRLERRDEQAAEFQVVGVADLFGIARHIQQGRHRVQVADLGPALRGLDIDRLLRGRDLQVAASAAVTVFDLLLGRKVLQGDHFRGPGSDRQQPQVGPLVEPVGRLPVTEELVVAIDAFGPAFQGGTQEFQFRIADDQALHGTTLYLLLVGLWLFDITLVNVAQILAPVF